MRSGQVADLVSVISDTCDVAGDLTQRPARGRIRSRSSADRPPSRIRQSSAKRRSRLRASLRSHSVKRAQSLSRATERPSQVSGTAARPARTASISARWPRR